MATIISGRKGGGGSKGHQPVEAPDSIRSVATAKILLALGEGEFAGGLDNTRIFFDGTPYGNADGTINFPGARWEFRPGTQHQTGIPGIPAVENEITVNTELKSSAPWVRAVSNTQLSAVRIRFGWPALQQQLNNGDTVGYRIQYAIDVATDGGPYREMVSAALNDKTTTLYERTHRVNLPAASTGWQIRVRRITPGANSNRIADTMNIEAISEVIDAKLRYPNTALLYVEFDAKQFQSIPKISCKPKGLIIRVPDTYDPVNRTYSGTWRGGFKWAHSNNPAWVFYDILLSERYGLGDRLDSLQISETELYRIAQYCDQRVPDGRGGSGTEPRFLCDVYIQSQEEAWTVLTDLAAIFRGMTYWGGEQIVTVCDMPEDVRYTFTRANVINGQFSYSSSSERVRYSQAAVSWSDPGNHYSDTLEIASEQKLIRRYGVNQTSVTAIGCTRQSEANRRGRWALLSNSHDNTASFSVGLDGAIPQPGRLIAVADYRHANAAIGGRIRQVEGRKITLDREPRAKAGDRLQLNLPSGRTQARTVQAVNGNMITVTTPYSETPEPEAAWAIDADDLALQLFRVVSIADGSDGTFDITAVAHDPNKYARIDTGARIEDRPTAILPPGVMPGPKNIAITSYSAVSQGIAITTMRATWDATPNAVAYEAEWRKDNNSWVPAPRTSAPGFEVPNIYAGRYLVRVRAVNASDIASPWATSAETVLTGKAGNPPKPVNFRASDDVVAGIRLDWNFADNTSDTLKTEIWYATDHHGSNALLLADVPYPQFTYQQMGLKFGQVFFYRAQLVDKTGNQSGWTEWVRGQSSSDAGDILAAIGDDIMTTEAGRELMARIDTDGDAIAENALANDADIRRWRKQDGNRRAEILEVRQVQVDDQRAFAQYQQLVSAQMDENSAAVQTTASALADVSGKLSAQYGVKVGVTQDGKYYAAGMGIGVENTPDGMQSQVIFLADRFAVMTNTAGKPQAFFAIQNGQTVIDTAFIGNATLSFAKISNDIQSENFIAGRQGWRWNKNGGVENYGADAQGAMKQTNTNISIRDTSRLRVQIGKITGVF